MVVVQMLLLFFFIVVVSACATHSLVESVTLFRGNKNQNPGNEEV